MLAPCSGPRSPAPALSSGPARADVRDELRRSSQRSVRWGRSPREHLQVCEKSAWLQFKLQAQSVISETHPVGQGRICLRVRKIVTDVRKEGSLWLEFLHNAERIRNRRMRRVGSVPQRVQEQNVETV